MTVLHLLGSPGDGGAETYFITLAGALKRAGLRQAAAIHANATREAQLASLSLPTRVLPFAAPFDLVSGPGIRRFAREQEARVLLQWMNRAGRVVPRRGPWTRIGRLGGYYDTKYYKGCEHLVALTPMILQSIVDQGWPRDRVSWIPNFATPGTDAIDRAEFDTPQGAPLLLAMGRLHEAKAHDVTLKALARLPGAWLWIAGSGPLEAELKALASSLGVADRVRFTGWRTDAPRLYRAADVVVFPSRYEPHGTVVLQAWADGVPLVTAASDGPKGLVRDGEDALLVPIDDDAALAAAIARVLDDAALAARLVRAGSARMETQFSEAAVVAAWRALFARFGEG